MNLPAPTMTAWVAHTPGEPGQVLRTEQLPVPVPGPGQVLLEVWAVALDRQDLLVLRGEHRRRPTFPLVPGLDVCGLVVAVGPGVSDHHVGDRVLAAAVLPYGGLARFAVAEAAELTLAPPGLDDESAAALAGTYPAAWIALYRRAALRVNETLLVHGAAGGIGSAAVQLGRAAGAKVIGVVSDVRTADTARAAGCDLVLDRSRYDLVDQVRSYTHGRGVDVVLDPVGGPAHAVSTAVVAPEGRIVVVGFASGQVPSPPLDHLVHGGYSLHGSDPDLYRAHDPELLRRCHDDLLRLVEAGVVRPLVGHRARFEDAGAVLGALDDGRAAGRVAVLPPGIAP